jgi:hypothetical protein
MLIVVDHCTTVLEKTAKTEISRSRIKAFFILK